MSDDEMLQDANGVWWNRRIYGGVEALVESLVQTNSVFDTMYPRGRATFRIEMLTLSRGPVSALDFLRDLTNALADVPEEFRAAAVLEMDAPYSQDGGDPTLEVYYERQETEGELEERKARHKADTEARAKAKVASDEKRERTMLANLKAKYEGKP